MATTRWAAGACAALAVFATESAGARDLTTTKTLYVVPDAHLDTTWLHTVKRTITDYLPSTLRRNFDLFGRYPGYVFNFEGAIRYMFIKEYYPADYEKLKGFIASGRWKIAGSFIDAGDVNVPSPESLFRHNLYASRFFRQEFGTPGGNDVFLPDCFGFSYALPTIAAHGGLGMFSTSKLEWGGAIAIPFDLGRWEGPDGSRIVAALQPGQYDQKFPGVASASATIARQAQRSGINAAYLFYGVGDVGGGPDDASVQAVEKALAGPNADGIQVVQGSSYAPLDDLTPAQIDKLPLHKGELILSKHGTGTYTTHGAIKWGNKRGEVLADAAERAAAFASWLGTTPYPRAALTEAWIRLLWHQGHDDITGTSIPEQYALTWNDQVLSQNQFASVLQQSVGAVARAMDTQIANGALASLVVWNPLASERTDVVEARVAFAGAAPSAVAVVGPDGKEVPSQVVASPGDPPSVRTVVFVARVPSVGLASYEVRPATMPALASTLTVTDRTLESERYKVRVSDAGDVDSIFDKKNQKELLKGAAHLQLFTPSNTTFPAWEIAAADLRAPRSVVDGAATISIVERGPARVALQIARAKEGSTFTQTVRLAAGDAGTRVEIVNAIDWKTARTILKAELPLSVSNQQATYDLGVGTIKRATNTDKSYEVPAQQWADLTDPDGAFGVAVLSDLKNGWDKPSNDVLRLTLLYTPPNSNEAFAFQQMNDVGRHRASYALVGHAGDAPAAGIDAEAARFNQPLWAFQVAPHAGALGRSASFLRVSDPAVAVRAVKLAEEGNEIVVRLQETSGKPIRGASLVFARPITSARDLNAREELVGALPASDGQLTIDLRAYQPRTIAVKLAPPDKAFSAPTSSMLTLPFEADVVTAANAKSDGAMDAQGNSYAAEVWPASVTFAGVPFALGPASAGAKNALTCAGQTLNLPEGDWNRVYLLAATTGADARAAFTVGDHSYDVTVQGWSEKIGRWNGGSDNPEGIKRDSVAWVGSHRNNRQGSKDAEVYELVYLHAIELPLGAGERTVKLPTSPETRVFAASVARNDNAFAWPASPDFPVAPERPGVALEGEPPKPGLDPVDPMPTAPPGSTGDGSGGGRAGSSGAAAAGGKTGGSAGAAGGQAPPDAPRSGCSCRIDRARGKSSPSALAIAMAVVAASLRRRRKL